MTAHMTLEAWIDATEKNYLSDFIRDGGAAVKFAVTVGSESTTDLGSAILKAAADDGYLTASVDASKTRVSAVEQVVFAICNQLDFGLLVDQLIARLARKVPYQVPESLDSTPVQQQIANCSNVGVGLVAMEIRELLTSELMENTLLARDFKIALTRLAYTRLSGGDRYPMALETVSAWLGGNIRSLFELREFMIHSKITRANARSVFASLLTSLSIAGIPGLVVTVDISQFMDTERRPEDVNYSKPALLDAYEVLREFIDATDDLEHLLLIVTAPQSFLDIQNTGRGIGRYDALKNRIYDEVRDRNLANPMSALIRVGNNSTEEIS